MRKGIRWHSDTISVQSTNKVKEYRVLISKLNRISLEHFVSVELEMSTRLETLTVLPSLCSCWLKSFPSSSWTAYPYLEEIKLEFDLMNLMMKKLKWFRGPPVQLKAMKGRPVLAESNLLQG